MYFEIEPKSRREDFFGYGYEYNRLKDALTRREKIIAVVGVRRVGKTSLLNVMYNEIACPKLWLDGRIVTDPKKEIFAAICEAAKSGKPKIFGKVDSLNLSAYGIGLGVKIGPESRAAIEKTIRDRGQICVFIAKGLADVLSYFYDRFPKVSFVLSGSEVGLVEDILGEADSEHPLYGRDINKITINMLGKNEAADYLKKGFAQQKTAITDGEVRQAVDELDGLIGWLTLYGYELGVKKSKDALNRTVQIAAMIAASELVHFLKKTKNRKLYVCILRNVDASAWEELRAQAGKDYGKKLNPNLFAFALDRLEAHSFIEKKDGKYSLSDPLMSKAAFLV